LSTVTVKPNYIDFEPLTEDPTEITAGMIWFRQDLGKFRISLDGVNVCNMPSEYEYSKEESSLAANATYTVTSIGLFNWARSSTNLVLQYYVGYWITAGVTQQDFINAANNRIRIYNSGTTEEYFVLMRMYNSEPITSYTHTEILSTGIGWLTVSDNLMRVLVPKWADHHIEYSTIAGPGPVPTPKTGHRRIVLGDVYLDKLEDVSYRILKTNCVEAKI